MKNDLTSYDFPAELKSMEPGQLDVLASLIRSFLIDNISKTGGHLASNLGVVELSIALHRVFNSPRDKIIWDVGHQCYVHKILTGRAGDFSGLRKLSGLSGFPKRHESEHDFFDSGHSSNSISVAMGFAEARDILKSDSEVIAVIGDGALTGGLAYEGLNNVGIKNTKLIVILNDNEMSISKNIGGVSQHLSHLRTSLKYLEFKKYLKKSIKQIPGIGGGIYNGMEHIRDVIKFMTIHSGAIFESLGFKYFGPVDGHNIRDLTEVLSIASLIDQPVFIHVITKKGKGYRNAELNPGRFHGIGSFDPTMGQPLDLKCENYADVFGNKLMEMAEKDHRVTAITAAMTDGTGLAGFARNMPDRFFDAGIAEAHAVSFAAGLACSGLKPYVAIYSTFLQRAYDQIIEDVCMQGLPVTFCIDRAGAVGEDGETHQGIYDLSYLGNVPGLTVMAPASGRELMLMLEFSLGFKEPLAIRYSKNRDMVFESSEACKDVESGIVYGKSVRIREGNDVDIWALGSMAGTGCEVCEILASAGISAGLVIPRFVKPFDEDELLRAAERCGRIVSLEDNIVLGGFGESLAAFLEKHDGTGARILNLGWPDGFLEHGGVAALRMKYGLGAESAAEAIRGFVGCDG